jgi:hypothetical protein
MEHLPILGYNVASQWVGSDERSIGRNAGMEYIQVVGRFTYHVFNGIRFVWETASKCSNDRCSSKE